MLGLRTQESKKFNNFFEVVQKKAQEVDSVFFLDSGDGNDFENEIMECENLQGWLVPISKLSEFNEKWEKEEEDDEWVDFFCFVKWSMNNGNIEVLFVE